MLDRGHVRGVVLDGHVAVQPRLVSRPDPAIDIQPIAPTVDPEFPRGVDRAFDLPSAVDRRVLDGARIGQDAAHHDKETPDGPDASLEHQIGGDEVHVRFTRQQRIGIRDRIHAKRVGKGVKAMLDIMQSVGVIDIALAMGDRIELSEIQFGQRLRAGVLEDEALHVAGILNRISVPGQDVAQHVVGASAQHDGVCGVDRIGVEIGGNGPAHQGFESLRDRGAAWRSGAVNAAQGPFLGNLHDVGAGVTQRRREGARQGDPVGADAKAADGVVNAGFGQVKGVGLGGIPLGRLLLTEAAYRHGGAEGQADHDEEVAEDQHGPTGLAQGTKNTSRARGLVWLILAAPDSPGDVWLPPAHHGCSAATDALTPPEGGNCSSRSSSCPYSMSGSCLPCEGALGSLRVVN